LAKGYKRRRDQLHPALVEAGFKAYLPRGAYYIMTDINNFGFSDDVSFARYLVKDIGVAAVPGSSFYSDPARGARQVRFAFCKTETTLREAAHRLRRIAKM
jgi:aminotransferase